MRCRGLIALLIWGQSVAAADLGTWGDLCLEGGDLDIAYLSEIDPTWTDSSLTTILNPEAVIFANPIAQGACAADAIASAFNMPLDVLFWCAGSQGSMYPFNGWVSSRSCNDGADRWSGVVCRKIITPFLARGFFPGILRLSSGCAGRSGVVTGMILTLILIINKQHNTGYL